MHTYHNEGVIYRPKVLLAVIANVVTLANALTLANAVAASKPRVKCPSLIIKLSKAFTAYTLWTEISPHPLSLQR